ncbi:MAG: hypothetical protein IKV53_04725 [Clostridia bacterium]|nr:hypothetical protein [Clostridia bacterium]
MSKYRIKNGNLRKPLPVEENSPLLEDVELENEIPDEEAQGAFFTGEDSTKVFKSSDVDMDDGLSELFGDGDTKKKDKKKDKDKKKEKKKDKEKSFSEKLMDIPLEEPSPEIEEDEDESLKPYLDLGKKKQKKKKKHLDLDGDDDEYDTESPSLDKIFTSIDVDDDDDEEDDYDDEVKKKPVEEEYTSPEQREEFIANYKRRSRNALASAFLGLIFTVLLFLHESPGVLHPEWLTQGKYGILYLLFDLQCLVFAGACTYKVFFNGAKALFTWKPNKYSIAFLLECVCATQILLHLIFDMASDSTVLFSSVAAFSAFICAIASYLDIRREGISFRVTSADTQKFVANTLDETSEEYTAFDQYLPEEPYLYSLGKTGFVKGFIAKSREESSFGDIYKVMLPLIVFTSVIFAVIANIMSGNPTFGRTLDNLVLALVISTPVFSVLSVSLPFLKGILKLSHGGSTVIGEASLDSCSSASVISFKDTDAFNAKGIVLSTVVPFGEARMDTAILTAARVFTLVGGPLKDVFNRAIIDSGSSGLSEDDEILEILPASIAAVIDDKNVLFGTKSAVRSLGVVCPDDPVDSMFEASGGRIMYMLTENELSAKFYVKYSLGRNFKAILDKFYDAGIFMVIKSCDPNLDTGYMTRMLRDDNYPIVVSKLNQAEYITAGETSVEASSPIVSNKSVPSVLRTFAWCDKCRHIINLNNLARFATIVLSVIILIACMLNANAHEKITPIIVLIYQLIWSLPILGTSIFQ